MNLDLTELFLLIFERGYPPWLSCPRASQPAWLPGFVQKRSLKSLTRIVLAYKSFFSKKIWFFAKCYLSKYNSGILIFYNKHLFYLTLKKKIVN